MEQKGCQRLPKCRSNAYFWEVAKVAEEISQNLSHNDASSIPQNGVSTVLGINGGRPPYQNSQAGPRVPEAPI